MNELTTHIEAMSDIALNSMLDLIDPDEPVWARLKKEATFRRVSKHADSASPTDAILMKKQLDLCRQAQIFKDRLLLHKGFLSELIELVDFYNLNG